jgi:hypothetical protein
MSASTTFNAENVPSLGNARRGLSALIAVLLVVIGLAGWSHTDAPRLDAPRHVAAASVHAGVLG